MVLLADRNLLEWEDSCLNTPQVDWAQQSPNDKHLDIRLGLNTTAETDRWRRYNTGVMYRSSDQDYDSRGERA